MLDAARERAFSRDARLPLADARFLPLADGAVDAVLTTGCSVR